MKIGDKVKIIEKKVNEYHNDDDKGIDGVWCDEAPELFKRGRVFTITHINDDDELDDDESLNRYYIDNGIGGSWKRHNLILASNLPEELFTI